MDTCMKDMLADMGITDPESQESAIKDLIRKGVISGRRKRTNIAITKLKRVESCLPRDLLLALPEWRLQEGCQSRHATATARGKVSLCLLRRFRRPAVAKENV